SQSCSQKGAIGYFKLSTIVIRIFAALAVALAVQACAPQGQIESLSASSHSPSAGSQAPRPFPEDEVVLSPTVQGRFMEHSPGVGYGRTHGSQVVVYSNFGYMMIPEDPNAPRQPVNIQNGFLGILKGMTQ